jgi:hypothetical protein
VIKLFPRGKDGIDPHFLGDVVMDTDASFEDAERILLAAEKAIQAKNGIYVCGPMTGHIEHNFPAFHAATKRLRDKGHFVVNPAELNPGPWPGLTNDQIWDTCMRKDVIEIMLKCNRVALLDEWYTSRGGRIEVTLTSNLGFKVAPEKDF